MPLHATAKRRIVTLVLIVVLLGAGLIAWVAFRESRKRVNAMDHRATGLAAFEEGHYLQASHHLHEFLRYQDADVEAHLRYAEAQLRVPQPDARNVTQALRSLLRIRDLDPENATANSQLLDLYLLIGKNDEALSLADSMLRREPRSVVALRGRALALSRLRRFAEAQDAAEQLVQLDATDTDMQLLYLEMENKTHAPREDLLAYAERMKLEHADDPRFDLVQAYAHYLANDRQTMTTLLKQAADATPPDVSYVNTLVRFADAVGLFPISMQALKVADETLGNENIARELTMRLMEVGKYESVARAWRTWMHRRTRWTWKARRCASSHRCAPTADRKPNPSSNSSRPVRRTPPRWRRGDMLETLFREQGVDADELVVTARSDLTLSPNSPWIRAVYGDAYYARGEPEQAIEQWEEASRLRPSWANPLIRQVQPLVALDRTQDAVERALRGIDADPQ